jgi:transcriptional regulator with XRE-family HTH domain
VKPYKRKEAFGAFGTRLKAERMRRGFGLERFAAECFLHQCQITAYENRGVYPSLRSIIKMAIVLECSIDYLVGLED